MASCVIGLFLLTIRLRPSVTVATTMMPVVHEEMHQRTSQYEQPWQRAQNMRGVLGQ